MSLKKKSNIFRTVVFRLTVWHTLFFAGALIVVFIFSKMMLSANHIKMIDQSLFLETQDFDTDLKNDGIEELKNDIYEDAEKEGLRRVFYRVLSSNLEEIKSSDLREWKHLDLKELKELAQFSVSNKIAYRTIVFPDKQFNVRVISRIIGNGKYVLQIGKVIHDNEIIIARYNKILGGIIIVMLFCGAFLGWWVTKKTMASVEHITQTALRIGKDGFKHRVQMGNQGEEIDRLASAFNNMLDRIEVLMLDLRDVTNNVAHDLRTPITRIRGISETTLQNKENIEDYREGYESILEECNYLQNLINTILEISEIDSGIKKGRKTKIELVDLVKKGYELFLPVAEDKSIQLEFKSSDDPIYISGDAPQLQRIVSNLLDNALKFTKENGNVLIEVKKMEDNAKISVQDTGIGIDTANLTRIFEKFYRIESSRSTPGSGLGLSWIKSILSTTDGTISVQSTLGQGSTFTVHIPLLTSV